MRRNVAVQTGWEDSLHPITMSFNKAMSVGSNLALAAPLGLQLPGFANDPFPQTGLLQEALRPKKARVLHGAFTRPSYAVMFNVATLFLSQLAKCIASLRI